jgi:hypothetical protein
MRFLNKYDGRSGGGCCVASPLWNGITCKNSSYISTTPSVLPACWNSQNPQLTRFSNTADICFKSPLGFRGFFPFANPPLLTDDSSGTRREDKPLATRGKFKCLLTLLCKALHRCTISIAMSWDRERDRERQESYHSDYATVSVVIGLMQGTPGWRHSIPSYGALATASENWTKEVTLRNALCRYGAWWRWPTIVLEGF